jgi:tetratricopeptide (TPR) repeat protein
MMVGLGTLSGFLNDSETAADMLSRAIELYRELDVEGADPALFRYSYSAALINYAATYAEPTQDYQLSEELNREALEVSRRMGDAAGVAVALGNLAEAATRKGDVEAARRGFSEGIAASRELGSAHRTAEAIIQCAVFEASVDNPRHAADLFEEAKVAAADGSLPIYEALCGALRAVVGQEMGESDARERFIAHAMVMYADPEFTSIYWPQLVVALGRADIESRASDPERAARLLGVVERLEDESSQLDLAFEARRSGIRKALMETLGHDAYEAAAAQGRQLLVDDAAQLIAGE